MIKKYIIILLLLCAYSADAATYYVKNGGSDTADGLSDETAWASLYKASTATADGDTIYLHRGDTWTVTVNRISSCAVGIGLSFVGGACSGSTPDENITVDAYGTGAKPIIDASAQTDINTSKITPAYAPVAMRGSVGGMTIKNLDLRGPTSGPAIQMYDSGNGNTIQGCTITGPGWASEALIQVDHNNHLIADNDFAWSTYYSKGIEFFGGYGNTVLRNRFIAGSYCTGGIIRFANQWTGTVTIDGNYFEVTDTSCTLGNYTVVVRDGGSDTGIAIIRNNIWNLLGLSGCGDATALELWTSHAEISPTHYFYNNTFIGNSDQEVVNTYATSYFSNNIVIGFGDVCKQADDFTQAYNNIVYNSADGLSACGTTNEAGTITSNPNLVDPTFATSGNQTDAYLTVSSTAAIDAGTGTPGSGYYPSLDIAGNARSAPVDIGAMEYGATPIGGRRSSAEYISGGMRVGN